jgi:thymidylate synthase
MEPPTNNSDELKIGFLFDHIFGKRVVNHLINKPGYCTKCGPLCINCRDNYNWFAGKIHYVHQVNWDVYNDIDLCFEAIEEKLSKMDVLVCIGLPEQILMEIPNLLIDFEISAVIFPVEDGAWISPQQQFSLQMELQNANIQFSFPRPFCSLKIEKTPNKSIINTFIHQFNIGKPEIQITIRNDRIVNSQIIRSAPCGATYYITQFLRNEQLNTWNTDSLEKRISIALNQFPCIAARTRDPAIESITRIKADSIAHDTILSAFRNPNQ